MGYMRGSKRSRRVVGLLLACGLAAAVVALAKSGSPGSLDPSFTSLPGRVITPFGSGAERANALAVQSDGKLVAAGFSFNGFNNDFALARYNGNGSLDPSFSSDGKLTTAIDSGHDEASGVAIQPDGKIVAAGYSYNGANLDFALVRYTTDGSLDMSFGSGGKVTTPIGAKGDLAFGLAVQPNGKLVAAGYSSVGAEADFALVRYNANGSLDTSFSGDGKLTTPIGAGIDQAFAVLIQMDGKIVAAGNSRNGVIYDFAAVRYNKDGSLDTSFSGDGKVATPVGSSGGAAFSLAVQPDGKLVAAGYGGNQGTDFALARYNSDGSLDTSFDGDGKVLTAIGSFADFGYQVVIQNDGSIVVAGGTDTDNNANYDFALARYLP